MSEDNTENTEGKRSPKKITIFIIGAFVLMIAAIFTIWQVLLKGKTEDEISNRKDTIVQVKTDTVKIKNSLNRITKHIETDNNLTTQSDKELTKDTTKDHSRIKNLSDEDKRKIKEKLSDLPKNRQDKIKKKLKSGLNK